MPYGERYIWGATAGMIMNLYDRLYRSAMKPPPSLKREDWLNDGALRRVFDALEWPAAKPALPAARCATRSWANPWTISTSRRLLRPSR